MKVVFLCVSSTSLTKQQIFLKNVLSICIMIYATCWEYMGAKLAFVKLRWGIQKKKIEKENEYRSTIQMMGSHICWFKKRYWCSRRFQNSFDLVYSKLFFLLLVILIIMIIILIRMISKVVLGMPFYSQTSKKKPQ